MHATAPAPKADAQPNAEAHILARLTLHRLMPNRPRGRPTLMPMLRRAHTRLTLTPLQLRPTVTPRQKCSCAPTTPSPKPRHSHTRPTRSPP
eukprot:5349511-Pleurochrysis_carterae.AAC.1